MVGLGVQVVAGEAAHTRVLVGLQDGDGQVARSGKAVGWGVHAH